MDLIQPYLNYFAAHPDWAVGIVFLIAFGEALLIIGLFVPSTAVLVGAGVLVGTHHLPFWPIFIATTAGAVAGDQISYWAGRLYGQKLKSMWPLNRYPQLVERGEEFIRLHGGKSIAIGRFVPGVKAVVPGIVGMFGMGQIAFVLINVSSGIVWSSAHVFPGMLIGQGLTFAGELSGRLVVVLLVLLIILAVVGYVIRVVVAGLSPLFNHLLGRTSQWAKSRKSRPMRRFGRAIAPENPRSLVIVLFAAIVLTGIMGLLSLILRVASADTVSHFDVSLFNLMREMRNAPADELMITLTMLGDTLVMTVVSLVVIGWLAWHKAYRASIAAAVTILVAKAFVPIMKYAIQRPRPLGLYDGAEQFSFPSGHATMAAVIFGILAVLVSRSMGRWSRSLVYALCAIAVVAIAFSRVYLGAHWLSDVAGGLLFGAVMTAAFGVAIEAIPPRRIMPVGLFAAAVITFIAAGTFHVATGYDDAEETYAPPQRMFPQYLADWADHGWQSMPRRRIDLVGKVGETFLVQVAGSLDPLRLALARQGWQETPKWTWRQAIPYLNPNAGLDDLLPRPALHEGLKARLTLVRKQSDTEREVLRIYKTDRLILAHDYRVPLYLVSLTREQLRHSFRLYTIPRSVVAHIDERGVFLDQLAEDPELYRLVRHKVNQLRQDLYVTFP